MARPLRLDFPGALWHIFSRGNERKRIFRNDVDRRRFLFDLGETVESCRWRLFAFVLMTNHYHLAFETTEANLSSGMHRLNGVYSQWFNRHHGRCGHLLQGRFGSKLVEKETYFLELMRYIVLNPVRAGMVLSAGDWPWSSYQATAGLVMPPPWLATETVLDAFRAPSRSEAQRLYADFVAEGSRSSDPYEQSKGSVVGSEKFRRQVTEIASAMPRSPEHPMEDRNPWRPTLRQIVDAVCIEFGICEDDLRLKHGVAAREVVAYLARRDGRIPLNEISRYLYVSDSSVSRLAHAPEDTAQLRSIRARLSGSASSLESFSHV